MREKCRAMTRDELIDKHIDIEGIKDAAVYILLFIEDVIKELRTDWCGEFEGKQDLKDLMEKYKEPLPETRKMAEKQAMIEKAGVTGRLNAKLKRLNERKNANFSKNLVKKMNFRCRNMIRKAKRKNSDRIKVRPEFLFSHKKDN